MSEQPAHPPLAGPVMAERISDAAPRVTTEDQPTIAGGVGAMLRQAREARNLSVADAAQALKLGPRQVMAIESEDWATLPGTTMIRGFVRNYARLLNLDIDLLMRGLDAQQLQQTAHLEVSAGTSASLPSSNGRRVERRDFLAIFAGLAVLVVALAAYYFVPHDYWHDKWATLVGSRSSPTIAEPVAPPPVESTPGAATSSGVPITVLATPNPVVLPDAANGARPAGPADSASAARVLKLSFRQPAWVEIRDGRGEVLLSGLNSGGSQREIAGQPPFALVVGNAGQVTLEYQGRVIDLASRSKDDVARLTLE